MKEYAPYIIFALNSLILTFCVWVFKQNDERKKENAELKEALKDKMQGIKDAHDTKFNDFKLEYTKTEVQMKEQIKQLEKDDAATKKAQEESQDLLSTIKEKLSDAVKVIDILLLKNVRTANKG